MNTIIEKIRAEVKRRREKIRPTDTGEMKVVGTPTQLEQGWLNALSWMEKVLDTLKEQPVDLDNKTIMEEIRKLGCYPSEFDVARRFYELGRQSKPKVSEGLDGEITEFIANHYEVDYYDGLQHHGEYLDTYDVEDIARHFAKWGAEHLKK